MNELELERALQTWGRYYGERPPAEWQEGPAVGMLGVGAGYGGNPIATAMEYGSKHDASDPRAYQRPREAMRAWRDPCAGTPSRHYAGALHFSGADTSRTDPLASRVERAAIDLFRINAELGLVLRAQYCKRGTQREKTEWVNGQDRAIALKLRTYRDALARSRMWMMGRLSA